MSKKTLFLTLVLIFAQFLVVMNSFSATIARFNISPTSLNFDDQDPDLFPEVPASADLAVDFSIRKLSDAENWILELYSDGDLISGSDVIPIGNVRWTATGTGTPPGTFQNGTFGSGVYVQAGQGPGDSKTKKADVVCYFRFYLNNLWSYATGNYSKIITIRLTVPGDVQSLTFTLSTGLVSRAKLEFGIAVLDFSDADPDNFPSIPANANPLSATSSARTSASLTTTLTCIAGGDLISGSNTIPISNMSWTATGSGYGPGTMSNTTPQTAGSWVGPGKRAGAFNYFLVNSWLYAIGNYSTSIGYTLTAP